MTYELGSIRGGLTAVSDAQTYLTFVLLNVNLVAEDNERKVLWVMGASLNKELIAPAVKSLKRFRAVDVVYEYTAVCASIEGDAKRLETLLTRSVPQLCSG